MEIQLQFFYLLFQQAKELYMKKIFTTLFVLLGFQLAASAQLVLGLPDKEDAEKVKARTMIVVLREEDPKMVEKLKKQPPQLASYKADIVAYNEKIQRIAPQFWTLSKSVIFKPEAEVKALQKTKTKEFAYLEFRNEKLTENKGSDAVKYGPGMQWTTAALEIRFIEKPSAPPSGYATMKGSDQTDAELALAVKHLQYMYKNLDNKASKKEQHAQGIQKLATKTLLLDNAYLAPGLTEKTIKTVYPYPFQIVDNAAIEKAVMNSEPNVAVVSIVPVMGMPFLMHNVCSADGEGLTLDVPGAMSKSKTPLKITKESLAQYIKTK
ncbi:hypothetical protein [Adhaeribacter soli]|uniref:Uncharacterized protein n=1 Tax=Adhaeribacter soli TaxID=2607655 RepID=A0A5N1IUF7_9BACT|nr:hypothetical protein [Adhaeribacter soli]KAA9333571.1 hypothetical protein F0P94_09955 [Adhaeribacter soli]